MAKEVCPPCFGGSDSGKKSDCERCVFLESCRFYAESSNCDRSTGDVSFDRYSYSSDVSSKPEECSDESESDSGVDNSIVGNGGALEILEFLLDVDNYTAELLSEVLRGANSTEELAKKFGKSRQAIHRKLVDCCTEHPELRALFITRLFKCRRILSESERLKRRRLNAEARERKMAQYQPGLFE